MKSDLSEIQKTLWDTADELRANLGLRPSEYTRPVLGLLFLRFVDEKYAALKAELENDLKPNSRRTPDLAGPTFARIPCFCSVFGH